jgi:hypothetical protein
MQRPDTEQLIERITAGLTPVRPLRRTAATVLRWAGLAAALLGVAVLVSGLRHDLAARLMLPQEQINLAAALLTGVTAAIAALQLALPDRGARWALLPLPFAALWLSGLGWGCLREYAANGWPALTTSFECARFILGFGMPLTAALLWMARHAAHVRPAPVAAMAALGAAGLSATGLSLVHHLDASAMILIWHGGTAGLMVALAWWLGPPALRLAAARH